MLSKIISIDFISMKIMKLDWEEVFINSSTVCIRHCFFFLNIFLMDYMKLFPQIEATYQTLPEEDIALFKMHYEMITTAISDEDIT